MTTEAGLRLLRLLGKQSEGVTNNKAWRNGVQYAAECVEMSLPKIEAEAREQHEATLRERGWRDEYEAATDAAMNFGDGLAEGRAALLAELAPYLDHRVGCPGHHKPLSSGECTCGIAAVLDLIREAGKK